MYYCANRKPFPQTLKQNDWLCSLSNTKLCESSSQIYSSCSVWIGYHVLLPVFLLLLLHYLYFLLLLWNGVFIIQTLIFLCDLMQIFSSSLFCHSASFIFNTFYTQKIQTFITLILTFLPLLLLSLRFIVIPQ